MMQIARTYGLYSVMFTCYPATTINKQGGYYGFVNFFRPKNVVCRQIMLPWQPSETKMIIAAKKNILSHLRVNDGSI